MVQKTGGMSVGEGPEHEKAELPSNGDDDQSRVRMEVRDLEEDLAASIAVLRDRLSLTSLKSRARDELREMAVSKPKAALSSAGRTGGDLLKKFLETSRDQPIIPVAISAIVIGLTAIGRLIRKG